MTANPESTSLITAARSRPSTEIIALGKRLCAELQLDNSCETLSKWMAHILAEKIAACDSATDPVEKSALQQAAIDLILRLWERRYLLPGSCRPFRRVERAVTLIAERLSEAEANRLPIRQREEEVSGSEKLIHAIDDFCSEATRILALATIANQRDEDPLRWEEENREFLEQGERATLDLLLESLREMDESTAPDTSKPASSAERLAAVSSRIDDAKATLDRAIVEWRSLI